jgi:hypothetical protein
MKEDCYSGGFKMVNAKDKSDISYLWIGEAEGRAVLTRKNWLSRNDEG